MSVSRELKRRVGRYEPCLPRLAKEPPAGSGWIHEIKHDRFRIFAELNAGGVKLITAALATIGERAEHGPGAVRATDQIECT